MSIGIQITALGNAGHGSALLQGTAMEKMLKTLQRVQEFRMTQSVKLVSSDNILRDCGRITSVNITMVNVLWSSLSGLFTSYLYDIGRKTSKCHSR